MFAIGKDRVGIVTATAGTGKTELFETDQTGETVAWIDGCSFQVQTPVEVQNVETTTVMEYADCYMPSIDGTVTAADGTVIDFKAISSSKALREAATGRDYVMRGDAVFEGPPVPHVFARCERQK
jgi:hypothetical protein